MSDDFQSLQFLQSSEDVSLDTQAAIVQILHRASARLPQRGLQALQFIRWYCSNGNSIAESIIADRQLVGDTLVNRMVDALKATSLYEYLKSFNLNVSGK